MTRLDKLWRAVEGPGAPPRLDSGRVKARVNAVLGAGPAERRIDMRKRFCFILAAAAALAIMGTAFAAAVDWNALSAHFQGDTSLGLAYLDSEVRSVRDQNYVFAVEGSAADESNVYLVVSVTAVSDEAKAFLFSDDFNSMDTFSAYATASDGGELWAMSLGYHELQSGLPHCRRFAVDIGLEHAISGGTVYVRCGYMEKGKRVEVPITPASSVTVKIAASGTGVLKLEAEPDPASAPLTIQEITLSPFTCQMKTACTSVNIYPNIRFRMTDGSIRTQSQMLSLNSGVHSLAWTRYISELQYQFHEIQDLNKISAVIVFDMEYPRNGSRPVPAEPDPALEPFTVTRLDPLEEGAGYSIPVRELTEKLGGTFRADGEQAVCTYRDVAVVLQAGSRTALVNDRAVELKQAPAMRDGVLAAPYEAFTDAWGISACVQREDGERINEREVQLIWHDWYIVP